MALKDVARSPTSSFEVISTVESKLPSPILFEI